MNARGGILPRADASLQAAINQNHQTLCFSQVSFTMKAIPQEICVKLSVLWFALCFVCGSTPLLRAATVKFDGATTHQVMDGFGVNVNYRNWNGTELEPVLDAFIDQAGMTLFRVVHDLSDWEATNDNADPNVMNRKYYRTVYGSPEFTRLWDVFAYLNARGITEGAYLNFMGWGPAWMMGGDGRTLPAGMEAEWAEMIASALVYARYTRGLQFSLVAPNNEPDFYHEGIRIPYASQYATALHELAVRLDANGLEDVRFVGPDLAAGGTAYMPEMLADPLVAAKLGRFGVHSYQGGGGGSAGVRSFIAGSADPERRFWVTEFNVWCPTCDNGAEGTYDWDYTRGTADYLLNHLLNGASATFVYDGYDGVYAHHGYAWGYWGLFAVDDPNAPVKTYTPRKHFYTVAQVSKWVRPGAQRVEVSGSTDPFSPLLAFKQAELGQVTIVGINRSGSAAALNGTLASLPEVSRLDLYVTSATANLAPAGSVPVRDDGTFTATIPPDCVFTLTGATGVHVTLTEPADHARFNSPATIPMAATATTTAGGSIARVEFYRGSTKLGEATETPYRLTWDQVPTGDYPLTAVATDTLGTTGTSPIVNVAVVGPLARIEVAPAEATVVPGEGQRFVATGTDALGHVLDPSPAFSWFADGGGTVDGTGLFRADDNDGSAGGLFHVTAASDGVTGTAVVRVVGTGITGGTVLGNPNEGTLTDGLWDRGGWINAGRFRASRNATVTTVRAKVGTISGRYRCAVYADHQGRPDQLLSDTTEVVGPRDGWQVFPLTSPKLVLTSGQDYWLAIWSDDPGARVYYSADDTGTLRWGRYDYGAWPDPVAVTGGGSFDYCIYATDEALSNER